MFAYESLDVYKRAVIVNQSIYRIIKNPQISMSFLRNQLGRASLSILLNIAEGSAKSTARDRRNFFVIARGSVFECSSIISFLHIEKEISDQVKNELYADLEDISRMLYGLTKKLDTEIINRK